MAAYAASQPELVTNGTFDTDSDWTKGANWTISDGVATKSAGAQNSLVQSVTGITADTYYQISFDATVSSGTVTLFFTGTAVAAITTTGSYSYIVQDSGANDNLSFQGTFSAAATIDNISVKEISSHAATAPSDSARPTLASYNSPISSREVLTTTYGWNITDLSLIHI